MRRRGLVELRWLRLRAAAFLDRLLGPRCPYGCGQRLYPKDERPHYRLDHAGDDLPLFGYDGYDGVEGRGIG